jgi:hypothetical protein
MGVSSSAVYLSKASRCESIVSIPSESTPDWQYSRLTAEGLFKTRQPCNKLYMSYRQARRIRM